MRSSLFTFITILTICFLSACAPQKGSDDDDASVAATAPHNRNPAGSVAATMISPVTH